jgi:hypothetical protein
LRRLGSLFTLAAVVMLVVGTSVGVLAQGAAITLSPTSGFAAVNVTGAGFEGAGIITIEWDGTAVPTVPQTINLGGEVDGFTAIIVVPTQTTSGDH